MSVWTSSACIFAAGITTGVPFGRRQVIQVCGELGAIRPPSQLIPQTASASSSVKPVRWMSAATNG